MIHLLLPHWPYIWSINLIRLRDPQNEIPLDGLEVFYQDFLTTRLVELDAMRVALLANDFSVLKRFAHNWQGFSVIYGFGLLEVLSLELEVCAADGSVQACDHLLVEVADYLATKDFKF